MTERQNTLIRLSIRCFADGFSFYVQQETSYQRVLTKRNLPEKLLAKSLLDELEQSYPNEKPPIEMVVQNKNFRLIPQNLYRPTHVDKYIVGKFTPKQIHTEILEILACVNAYIVPVWVLSLSEKLNTLGVENSLSHSVTVDLNKTLQPYFEQNATVLSLRFDQDELNIIALSRGRLLLANTYTCCTPEDAAYHTLNSLQQLGLPVDDTKVLLSGEEDNKALRLLLSNYINI